MKKRFLFLLIILLLFSNSIFSSPNFYLSGNYTWTYDTNVFSNPLPRYAWDSWIDGKKESPFVKRFNNGFHLSFDTYFTTKARTGLSTSFDIGMAYKETCYIPEGSSTDDWFYKEVPVIKSSTKAFFGIGPVFRSVLGIVDIGVALRLSIGAYDYTANELILGIQAEPYLNLFITDNLFCNFSAQYNAHLVNFYLNNKDKYYRDNYVMMTVGAFVGLGFSFGDRGN